MIPISVRIAVACFQVRDKYSRSLHYTVEKQKEAAAMKLERIAKANPDMTETELRVAKNRLMKRAEGLAKAHNRTSELILAEKYEILNEAAVQWSVAPHILKKILTGTWQKPYTGEREELNQNTLKKWNLEY